MAKRVRKLNTNKNKTRVTSKSLTNGISTEYNKVEGGIIKEEHVNSNEEGKYKSGRPDAIKTSNKIKKQIGNKHELDDDNTALFPPYFQWIIFVCTLVFRLWYVSQKSNWWILHPDEVFQSMEVAHSEIYGYGFRPYEYLRPPDMENKNTTVARQLEYHLGMYSLRSFLFPRIFAYVGYMTISTGYSGGLFVIWKYFHVTVTSLLTVAVYLFTKTLSRSHDVAVTSCIITASSMYLNIIGTHTVINSFTSPFVFFVMYYILKNDSTNTKKQDVEDSNVSAVDEKYDTNLRYSNCDNETTGCSMERTPEQTILKLDHNGNVKNFVLVGNHVERKLSKKPTSYSQYVSVALSRISLDCLNACVVGCLLGILVYMRPDTLHIIIITVCLFGRLQGGKCKLYLLFICGASLGVCIGLIEDNRCYGAYTISPWQWFKFNIIGSSTRVFGFQPTLYYFKSLFHEDVLIRALSILFCIFVLVYNFQNKTTQKVRLVIKLCVEVLLIIVLYSLKGHKERRFIYDVIPLMFIIFSEMIIMLYKFIPVIYQSKLIIYSSLICIFSSQLRNFTTLDSNTLRKWTYNGIVNTSHVNICLDFISNQNNVTGVFSDSSIHMTGGYTILKQDVPIIALSHEQFLKFGKDSRFNLEPVIFNREPISIHTFSHFADFISIKNTEYLLKVLLSDPSYNYLVMDVDRRVNVGYTEVFRSGNMRVLNRIFDTRSEHALNSLVSKITFVKDVLLLNTEADWLIYYGAYDKAKERLKFAFETDSTNLESHQLLIQMYNIMGENKLTRMALRNCSYYHAKEKCLQFNLKHRNNR